LPQESSPAPRVAKIDTYNLLLDDGDKISSLVQEMTAGSHPSQSLVEYGFCLLTLFKEAPSNCWVNFGQISKQFLWLKVIFKEFESLSLSASECQTLDIVENKAGQIGIGAAQLCLSLFW